MDYNQMHHEPTPPTYTGPIKYPNAVFLFFTSFLPGLNYMYMGLIKRGIFIMSSFFALSYLAGFLHSSLLGLAIPILWFASFFEGFKIRRNLKHGFAVSDSIDDIKAFCSRYKTILVLFAAAVLAQSLFAMLFFTSRYTFFLFGHGLNRKGMFVILCAILLVICFRNRSRHNIQTTESSNISND